MDGMCTLFKLVCGLVSGSLFCNRCGCVGIACIILCRAPYTVSKYVTDERKNTTEGDRVDEHLTCPTSPYRMSPRRVSSNLRRLGVQRFTQFQNVSLSGVALSEASVTRVGVQVQAVHRGLRSEQVEGIRRKAKPLYDGVNISYIYVLMKGAPHNVCVSSDIGQ